MARARVIITYIFSIIWPMTILPQELIEVIGIVGRYITGTVALSASGGKLDFDTSGGDRGESGLTSGVGADGTTAYVSFLIDLSSGGSLFTGIEFRNGSSNNNAIRAIRVGFTGGSYAVETNTGSGSVALDSGLNFVVLKLNYVLGDDTVDVYVNPTLDDLNLGNFDGQLTGGNFAFDHIGLATFNSTADGFADEIRVGTELSDVAAIIPTPAALPAGLLMLGLLVVRRRRKSST